MKATEHNIEFSNQTFSVAEAASHLRISRAMLYRLIADGRLIATKIGTRTVFTGADLQRLLDASRAA